MHEFGLCEGIVDAIQRRANGRRVARVRIRVGAMHRVDHEAFKQAFSWAADQTEAQDATVDLMIASVRIVCHQCAAETESEDAILVCRSCGAVSFDVVQGNEIVLESIEYAA
jgi:hydrogenase nickel incorporation protein HypA/HybF